MLKGGETVGRNVRVVDPIIVRFSVSEAHVAAFVLGEERSLEGVLHDVIVRVVHRRLRSDHERSGHVAVPTNRILRCERGGFGPPAWHTVRQLDAELTLKGREAVGTVVTEIDGESRRGRGRAVHIRDERRECGSEASRLLTNVTLMIQEYAENLANSTIR